MVAVDLTAAFETVDYYHLLNDIASSNLSNNTKRRILAYLHGWILTHWIIEFKRRKMKQVVPQGGVFSPVLLNLHMSQMPQPKNKNIK